MDSMKYEVLEKEITLRVLVESQSNEGSFYNVRLRDGNWSCACKAHVLGEDWCKHIRFVKEEVL